MLRSVTQSGGLGAPRPTSCSVRVDVWSALLDSCEPVCDAQVIRAAHKNHSSVVLKPSPIGTSSDVERARQLLAAGQFVLAVSSWRSSLT